jgi:hypothetical protein
MLMHSAEEIGFRIIAILLLRQNLRAKNTVILLRLGERTTLFLEFVGPIDAGGLGRFVEGVHHGFVCFEGFI